MLEQRWTRHRHTPVFAVRDDTLDDLQNQPWDRANDEQREAMCDRNKRRLQEPRTPEMPPAAMMRVPSVRWFGPLATS
jgi:hypothetical protein